MSDKKAVVNGIYKDKIYSSMTKKEVISVKDGIVTFYWIFIVIFLLFNAKYLLT